MSFQDKLNEAIENAPEAGFVNINYGKLEFAVQVLSWKDKKPVRIPYDEDTDLKKGESLELSFKVGISELNPKIDFDYERQVRIVKSSATAKSDWTETVEPSLVKVFGKDWATVLTGKKQFYVAVEDVPTVTGNKTKLRDDGSGGTLYKTPKFVAKFKNLAECKAARDEKFGAADDSDDSDDGDIPASIIKKAKAAWKAVDEDEDTFKTLMENAPYDDYDVDELLEAVQG